MKYNKLVRDKIPKIIKHKGQIPLTRIASREEYKKRLYDKLREEVDEFLEDKNKEELADVLEVINSICEINNFDKEELEEIRKEKLEKKGGFNKRIILEEVK